MATRVFIAYAHADAAVARRLAVALEKRGVTVWLDEKEVRIGDSIPHQIGAGLSSSDFVCLLLSKASKNRPWVEREYSVALSLQLDSKTHKPRILPIRLDGSELPTLLSSVLAADFSTHFDLGLNSILSSIGIPQGPAPFVELPDALSTSAGDARTALAAALTNQDMEALTRVWYAVLDSARKLREELQQSRALIIRRQISIGDVDGLLAESPDAVAVVRLPKVVMIGTLSIERTSVGEPLYAVRMEGLDELLRALGRWPREIANRHLLLVPAGITWSSDAADHTFGELTFY